MFLSERRIVIKNQTSSARIRSQNLYDLAATIGRWCNSQDGEDDLVGDVDEVEAAVSDVAVPEDEHPDDVDSSGV